MTSTRGAKLVRASRTAATGSSIATTSETYLRARSASSVRGKRARARRLCRNECAPRPSQAVRASPSTSLSASTSRRRPSRRLGSRSSSQSIPSGVCAPSQISSSAAPLEAARERRHRRRPRSPGRGTPPLPRGAPPDPHIVVRARATAHSGSPSTTIALRRRRPRASRGRSPRASRRAPPCARARRSSAGRPARRGRSSRRACRRARPRRRRRRRPRAANSASAAAVSASNCVAPTRSRRLADAADRALEALVVGVEPLAPARDVRRRVAADAQALRPEQRRDRPRRRRLPVRADDVDGRDTPAPGGRARRAARACARGRTPRATARARRSRRCAVPLRHVDDSGMPAYPREVVERRRWPNA